MDIEFLRSNDLIIFETISGSRAYGLQTPESDTDIKGVFVLPKEIFYSLNYTPQVSNSTNDVVFYELSRYIELLAVNNPNILELLNTPKSCIINKHNYLDEVTTDLFLSKQCLNTFGKFALSQIKKAKGLNKKIVNPYPKERKNVLDFCYVGDSEYGSIPLIDFLERNNWKQQHCGLVNIPHMKGMYGLYYHESAGFNGIAKSEQAQQVSLSSIPKGLKQMAMLYYNKDGYSVYCREYKQYWSWVKNRNNARYQNTMNHGKNYDAKNMMHTFRLLDMAIEIGMHGEINVKRPNRDFLLEIKSGVHDYETLLEWADQKQQQMEDAFSKPSLPESVDMDTINLMLYRLREKFYS